MRNPFWFVADPIYVISDDPRCLGYGARRRIAYTPGFSGARSSSVRSPPRLNDVHPPNPYSVRSELFIEPPFETTLDQQGQQSKQLIVVVSAFSANHRCDHAGSAIADRSARRAAHQAAPSGRQSSRVA